MYNVALKTGVMAAENSALRSFPFEIYSNRKQLFEMTILFHNITTSLYFDPLNAALLSRRYFFQK